MEYRTLQVVSSETNIMIIPERRLLNVGADQKALLKNLEVRGGGSLIGRAFYLCTIECDWALGLDEQGMLCLVPLKKEE